MKDIPHEPCTKCAYWRTLGCDERKAEQVGDPDCWVPLRVLAIHDEQSINPIQKLRKLLEFLT
jgi:hypothetical protein